MLESLKCYSYESEYARFLPILDLNRTSPHELYNRSDLLFWSIISVAARRLKAQPILLPKLARSVTDLLWRTIRSVPHSVEVVQSLAILCTWPFPTSSSSADSTFMLAGLMLQIGTQMGLHCAHEAQDFAKAPLDLDAGDITLWSHTWEWCKIVAQRLVMIEALGGRWKSTNHLATSSQREPGLRSSVVITTTRQRLGDDKQRCAPRLGLYNQLSSTAGAV